MNKIISSSVNGRVFKCNTCKKVHIEYKNLNFNFLPDEYVRFSEFILNLDGKAWEKYNNESFYRRKIIIPIGHKNFNILINNEELAELKLLLSPKLDNTNEIDSYMIKNLVESVSCN